MQLLGHDDEDRAFVALPAAAVGLGAVLMAGMVLGRVAVPEPSRPGTEEATCLPALEQARTALAAADEVDATLTAQTDVIIDLRAGRLTSSQALDRAEPALTDAARHSVQLDVATQRFLQLANDCSG